MSLAEAGREIKKNSAMSPVALSALTGDALGFDFAQIKTVVVFRSEPRTLIPTGRQHPDSKSPF